MMSPDRASYLGDLRRLIDHCLWSRKASKELVPWLQKELFSRLEYDLPVYQMDVMREIDKLGGVQYFGPTQRKRCRDCGIVLCERDNYHGVCFRASGCKERAAERREFCRTVAAQLSGVPDHEVWQHALARWYNKPENL